MRVLEEMTGRVLPRVKERIEFRINESEEEYYRVYFSESLTIEASTAVAAAHGLYRYLKDIAKVNLSWNGNREITIATLPRFDGEIKGIIEPKYRVYMNYCTLNYTASWWNFERWEREIDFMALNGINMPLAVVGAEAVWFHTLKELGYGDEEALKTISGPAFFAWQLMTNIEGYLPPQDVKYIAERLELGRKVLLRMREFGMHPIQQGFSGHVPKSLKEKLPDADIAMKRGWCLFPETAQLDPLDPQFKRIGTIWLKKQEELLGNHGFYAADPFHENAPPERGEGYLASVGRAIDEMYREYDENSVWVMQSWSLRDKIVRAVPKGRLLILDIDGRKAKIHKFFYSHEFVTGILNNFGGKNAMQGRASAYAASAYKRLKKNKRAVCVGTGMFMEGIEQNPYIYDLIFEGLTKSDDIDLKEFTNDYIQRRYGRSSEGFKDVYRILLKTCYRNIGQDDTAIGSTLTARPDYMPKKASPCDSLVPYYRKGALNRAALLMLKEAGKENSDGYYYDLVDIMRQALSDLFYKNQKKFRRASITFNAEKMRRIADKQLELLLDMDKLLSSRCELSLSKWLGDAARLATDEKERRWFLLNARALVTLWGDINGDDSLFDYAWKEWSGLIAGYYYPRWERFYLAAIEAAQSRKLVKTDSSKKYFGRPKWRSTEFYNELADWELEWCRSGESADAAADTDPVEIAEKLAAKWLR